MSLNIPHKEKLIPVALILFSATIYSISTEFPSGQTGAPGAGFFPQLIAVGIVLLATVQITHATIADDNKAYQLELALIAQLGIPVLAVATYVLLLPALGFLIGTFIFLIVFMRYSGVRSYQQSVALSFVTSLVLHYTFDEFLSVPLPEGIVPIARLLPQLPLIIKVTV